MATGDPDTTALCDEADADELALLREGPSTHFRRVFEGRWQVWCDTCGSEGMLYTSRYGGNDPDVWPTGPCPDCVDHPGWMDWDGNDAE